MSGTSMDGLDIALCRFTGSGKTTRVELLHFVTSAYSAAFKAALKDIAFKEEVNLRKVTLLNAIIGSQSATMVLSALQEWGIEPREVDLIASHGQTIFHAPFSLHQQLGLPDATLQIGDGDHLAQSTGIITLSDFRQKHIAAGGEGAPVAVYGDYLLFADEVENRVLLNIGGISNFTWLPAGSAIDQVFSTDIGPGNTLMDQFVQKHYPGKYYDEHAEIARSGQPDSELLAALLAHPFFGQPFPRTTGPELFNLAYLEAALQRSAREEISKENILATLCSFTASSIVQAIQQASQGLPFGLYLSGGGMHNPLLRELIAAGLGSTLKDTAALGIAPDAKEAVLFALLANEGVAATEVQYGSHQGVPNVRMGKISLPG